MKYNEIVALGGIDLAVAVAKAVGLPHVELEDANCPYCDSDMRFCGERSWCSVCREWRYSPYKEYWHDMDAAMEVVEEISQRWFDAGLADIVFRLKYERRSLDGKTTWKGYKARFWAGVYIEGDTAAEATCRAVLLANTDIEKLEEYDGDEE